MKMQMKHVAPHELIDAILADFHYPRMDAYGTIAWSPSWVLSEHLFSRFKLDEALCEALKISEGEVFQLDKTLMETTVRKEFAAAKAFYAWMKLGTTICPQNYEFSEQTQALNEIAGKLGLSSYFFQQQDPLCIVNESGLRQGELIDSFGRRVFERLTKKWFREAIAQRKRDASSLMAKTERYFDRLSANCPTMGIVRVELHYKTEHALSISLEETSAHLDAFVRTLNGDDAEPFSGYWWKRRYIPECGFGHHFVQCFDALKVNLPTLLHGMGEAWRVSTKDTGFAVSLSHASDNHRSWGSGLTCSFSLSPVDQILRSVRLMLASERYLRLAPHRKYSHCGMGELPTLVQRDDAWTSPSPLPLL